MDFHPLESRTLFSGVVNITHFDGGIIIKGDAAANGMTLGLSDDGSGNPPNGIFIVVDHVTRLTGGSKSISLESGTIFTTTLGADLVIDLGGGEDFVGFQGIVEFGRTRIVMGDGNDAVSGQGKFSSLEVDTGGGDDRVRFTDDTAVTGNTSILTGPGRDRIELYRYASGAQFGGKLWIQDPSGPLSVVADRIYVRKQTVISSRNSLDRITLKECSFRGSVLIGTRRGDDVIDLTSSIFRSTKDIFAGSGNNTIIP